MRRVIHYIAKIQWNEKCTETSWKVSIINHRGSRSKLKIVNRHFPAFLSYLWTIATTTTSDLRKKKKKIPMHCSRKGRTGVREVTRSELGFSMTEEGAQVRRRVSSIPDKNLSQLTAALTPCDKMLSYQIK